MSLSAAVTVVASHVAEARMLREVGPLPGVTAAPVDMVTYLQDVRARQDRVEQLLSQAIQVRSAARRAAAALAAVADDAWDEAIKRTRARPVQPGGEYTSARERHADANLTIIDQRHAARAAADTADRCDELTELIRMIHRGLDTTRTDLHALLRTLTFESHLER